MKGIVIDGVDPLDFDKKIFNEQNHLVNLTVDEKTSDVCIWFLNLRTLLVDESGTIVRIIEPSEISSYMVSSTIKLNIEQSLTLIRVLNFFIKEGTLTDDKHTLKTYL